MQKIDKAIQAARDEIGLGIGGTTVLKLTVSHITPHIYGVEVQYYDDFANERVGVYLRMRFSNDFDKCEVATCKSCTVS